MSLRALLSLLLLPGAFLAAHAQSTTPTISAEGNGDAAASFNMEQGTASDRSPDKTPVTRVMQGLDSIQAIAQLPTRYLHKVNAKTDLLSRRMTRRSAKALRRLQHQEERMKARLMKIDSLAAHNLFTRSIDSLGHLRDMVRGKAARVTQLKDKIPGGQYIPYLDTLQGSLRFLDRYTARLDQAGALQDKLQSSLGHVRQLEGQLDQL